MSHRALGPQFPPIPDRLAYGRWVTGPQGEVVGFDAPHDHLLDYGLRALKGSHERMGPAIQAAASYRADAGAPEDMIRSAAAQAVLEEVHSQGASNTQTLYRGDRHPASGIKEFTPVREVAEGFARQYRGEVREFPPGTVHGITVGDYIGSTIDQSEKSFLGYLP